MIYDEENIIISLYASSVSDARVITKINRVTFEDIISSLDVGSVVNPKVITANHITTYVRGMQNSLGSNIETLYTFANGKAEALEFRVTKDFKKLGTRLMDLSLKKNLLIVFDGKEAGGSYKGWNTEATLTLDHFDSVAEKIYFSFSINSIERGTVTVENGVPTFVKAE